MLIDLFTDDVVVNAADIKDLDLDPELGILDEEAEAWVGTVDKKISKKLKEKEIKRQEHIYEFIITEKHHCLTLKVMQKVRQHFYRLRLVPFVYLKKKMTSHEISNLRSLRRECDGRCGSLRRRSTESSPASKS